MEIFLQAGYKNGFLLWGCSKYIEREIYVADQLAQLVMALADG